MSPMVACCWFVDCLILMDFRSLVLVTIRSFQLMKRIDMSCLDRRFEARIVLMKTLYKLCLRLRFGRIIGELPHTPT